MKSSVKKYLSALLIFLLMSGIYAGVISLCNRWLRENDWLTIPTKLLVGAILFIGFYLIYKWFAKRLSKIDNQELAKEKSDE